ncbi:hypothetical protein ND894_15155 [Priestia megaterium]|uniref:hypothetical protein n=1 Tax=Priestia megaterium TaxID=1404 RepID=UPI002076728F|nr:hypothetical protein [Priestia megaterium]USD19265.1 hypothetical protein ND894_15155 [Priestia megaterium]
MTLINSGTCVGVLYRANAGASCRNGYCVHNGRLVGGVISSNAGTLTVTRSIDNTKLQTYNGILLSHRAVNRTTGQVTQQYLYFRKNQLEKVEVTPYTQYSDPSCQRESHYNIPDIIYPGECVGIRYLAGDEWHIGNGRYLYWTGQVNHCIFDERSQSTNRQFLRQIWYVHWILDPNNERNIIPQKTSRGRGSPRGERRIYVFKNLLPANGETVLVKAASPVNSASWPFRIIYQ